MAPSMLSRRYRSTSARQERCWLVLIVQTNRLVVEQGTPTFQEMMRCATHKEFRLCLERNVDEGVGTNQ